MPDPLPTLFIKTGCPWCEDAITFLTDKGIGYQERNVTEDPEAYQEMLRVSNQTKTPVLDWHGKILADFGLEELQDFLLERNVQLEDS
jgi:glutaredoxin